MFVLPWPVPRPQYVSVLLEMYRINAACALKFAVGLIFFYLNWPELYFCVGIIFGCVLKPHHGASNMMHIKHSRAN